MAGGELYCHHHFLTNEILQLTFPNVFGGRLRKDSTSWNSGLGFYQILSTEILSNASRQTKDEIPERCEKDFCRTCCVWEAQLLDYVSVPGSHKANICAQGYVPLFDFGLDKRWYCRGDDDGDDDDGDDGDGGESNIMR